MLTSRPAIIGLPPDWPFSAHMLLSDLCECRFHGVIIPSVKEKSRVFQGFWLQAKPFNYRRKHVSLDTAELVASVVNGILRRKLNFLIDVYQLSCDSTNQVLFFVYHEEHREVIW